jgi:hypothetical protein
MRRRTMTENFKTGQVVMWYDRGQPTREVTVFDHDSEYAYIREWGHIVAYRQSDGGRDEDGPDATHHLVSEEMLGLTPA